MNATHIKIILDFILNSSFFLLEKTYITLIILYRFNGPIYIKYLNLVFRLQIFFVVFVVAYDLFCIGIHFTFTSFNIHLIWIFLFLFLVKWWFQFNNCCFFFSLHFCCCFCVENFLKQGCATHMCVTQWITVEKHYIIIP